MEEDILKDGNLKEDQNNTEEHHINDEQNIEEVEIPLVRGVDKSGLSGSNDSDPAPKAKKRKLWPFILIVVIGLIIFISPVIGRVIGYFEDKILMNSEWSDEDKTTITQPEVDDLSGLDDTFNAENQDSDGEDTEEDNDSVIAVVTYKPTVIGSITIPKLDLTRPIANDVQKRDLRVAIGKIPGSSGIGQAGNVTLAGHRNYAYKEFFDNLDKMEIGDTIILKSNTGTYTYEVYDIFVTTADDVSVMTINRSESICTLITCDPKYIANNRLIVKGCLIESEVSD